MRKLNTFFGVALILGWWLIAFSSWKPFTPRQNHLSTSSYHVTDSTLLLPLNRDEVQAALWGDVQTILKLISQWDTEAALLLKDGVENVQRLNGEDYFEAQRIGRSLLLSKESPSDRLLPQTLVSATFLMALCPPENLIAMPKLMKENPSLYPSAYTEQVSLDIDRYHSEKVFMLRPRLAFTAPYSNPAVVEALHQQGIPLHSIHNIESVDGIQSSLQETGDLVNQTDKASLLVFFLKALFASVDNHMLIYRNHDYLDKTLYLTFRGRCYAPSKRTLTGQSLERLGLSTLNQSVTELLGEDPWQVGVDMEHLVRLQPEVIILAVSNGEEAKQWLLSQQALENVPALLHERVYIVNSDVQDSPTQLIGLAYLDLAESYLKAIREER